uniref:Retrotransposon gag domain-containing protein n=1 Tax=Cacopsylla melanoneura TaxID=428564 RepID=A0A8D8LHC2_9HEMI
MPETSATEWAAVLEALRVQGEAIQLLLQRTTASNSSNDANSRAIVSHNITIEMFDPEEEDFSSYLERLENFFTLRDTQDDSAKRCVLLGCLQREQFKQLSALTAPAKPFEKTFTQLIVILQKSFNPITSIHTERHRFLSRVQGKAETLASYISELKVMGQKCQWVCPDAACQKPFDSIFQAQFIRGIRENYIRENLLLLPTETSLEKILETGLALEAAHKQNVEEYTDESSGDLYIHKVSNETYPFSKSSRSRYPPRSSSPPRHSSTTTYKRKCQLQERLHELGLEDMCLRCGQVKLVHSAQDLDVNSTAYQYIDLRSINSSSKFKRPGSPALGHLRSSSSSRRFSYKPVLPTCKVRPPRLHEGCSSRRGDCYVF